jgi:RNA polymerase sigma factor (sigma-70 family)
VSAPLLTKEEEKTLFLEIEKGDVPARNRVIMANTRLVLYIAKRFIAPDFTLDDAFCVGLVGLERAIKNFKVEKGYRFSTFASRCIYTSLLDDLEDRNKKKRYEVSGFYETVTRTGEVTSHHDTFSEGKGGPDKRRAVPWFNAEWKANQGAYPNLIEFKEDHNKLHRVLNSLDEKSRDIINARFGFPPYDRVITLRELGRTYGVTKQCISLWEDKAMSLLRRGFSEELQNA